MFTNSDSLIKIIPTACPVYSLGFYALHTPILSSVTIRGVSGLSAHTVSISVYGLSKSGFFLERTALPSGELFFHESESDIHIDLRKVTLHIRREFFRTVKSAVTGKLCVEVVLDGVRYFGDAPITLLPARVYPVSASPSYFAACLTPFHPQISQIVGEIKKNTPEELYTALKRQSIIYSVKECDFLRKNTVFCDAEALFNGRARMASPLEMAQLFCAAALRMGLSPIVAAAKGPKAYRIYCGVIEKDVSETALTPRRFLSALSDGSAFVFDVFCLFTGHNVEPQDACRKALEELNGAPPVFLSDIRQTLRDGADFFGLYPEDAAREKALLDTIREKAHEKKRTLSSFAEALTHTDRTPLLSYSVAEYGGIPVSLSDFSHLPSIAAADTEYTLFGTTDFPEFRKIAPFVDELDSSAAHVPNGPEKEEIDLAVSNYREKLFCAEQKNMLGVPQSLSLQPERADSLFAQIDGGEAELYLACGFLRCGGKTAPVALYPVTLTLNGSRAFLRFAAGTPYVNRLLCETLKDSKARSYFERYGLPGNDFSDIMTCFEGLCRLGGFSLCKEARIAALPYRASIAAFDIADKSEKIAADKTASLLLSETRKDASFPDEAAYRDRVRSLEETQSRAFSNDALFACAVSRDEDLLLSCADPDLALQSALAAAQNNLRLGFSTLICAEENASLSALADAFAEDDFSEPFLMLYDGCDPKDVLRRKLDILSKASLPDEDDTDFSENEKEYHTLLERLRAYRDGKAKRRDFGFSFYDAARAYTAAGDRLTAEERDIILEPETLFYPDMGKATAENLLEAQKKLCRAARALFPDKPYSSHPFYCAKTTDSDLKIPTAAHLAEKCRLGWEEFSSAAQNVVGCMHFTHGEITSLPSLYALLSLAVLLLRKYDDGMTDGLLTADIYALSEKIGVLSELSRDLEAEKRALAEYDDGIFTLDARELFAEWTSEKTMSRSDIVKTVDAYHTAESGLPHSVPKKDVYEVLEALYRISDLCRRFEEESVSVSPLFSGYWNGTATEWEKLSSLLDFAKGADVLLKKIYGTDTELRKEAAGRLPIAARELHENSEHGSDILKAAGLFDRMFSDDSCFLSLSSYLGVDLYALRFSDGILSENGFLKRICDWQSNMSVLPLVAEYNRCCECCRTLGLSVFADYLAAHAATPSDDAIFLRSQLHLIMKQIALSDKNLLSYPDYASDIKRFRALHTARIRQNRRELKRLYFRRCSAYIRENPEKAAAFAEDLERQNVGAADILLRHGDLLHALFPVMAVQPFYCGFLSGFETLVVLGAEHMSPEKIISRLPCAKHKLFLTDSANRKENSVAEILQNSGISVYDSAFRKARKAVSLSHLLSPVSGFDRESGTNIPEAQTVGLELLRSAEQNPSLRAALLAPNRAQTGALRGVLRILCEKSAAVDKAVKERRIDVLCSDGMILRQYDKIIASALYTADCGDTDPHHAPERLLSALCKADAERAVLVSVFPPHRYPETAGARAPLAAEAITSAAQEGINALYPPSHFTSDAQYCAVEFCRLLSREKIPCALARNGCGVLFGKEEPKTVCLFDDESLSLFRPVPDEDESVRFFDSAELYLNPQKLLENIIPTEKEETI